MTSDHIDRATANPGATHSGPLCQKYWYASWALLAMLAVALIPAHFRFGSPVWLLPVNPFVEVIAVSLAFLCQAIVLFGALDQVKWRAVVVVGIASIVFHGMAYFLLYLRPGSAESRLYFVLAACSGMALSCAVVFFGRHIRSIVGALAFVVVVEAAIGAQASTNVSVDSSPKKEVFSTTLHRVSLTFYSVLDDPKRARVRGGGLAAIDDGTYLLVTGEGEFYQLSWGTDNALRGVHLPISAPLGGKVHAARFSDEDLTLRVTGLAIQAVGTSALLFVVHDYWNTSERCFTTRVSMLDVTLGASITPVSEWKTLFQAQPCLALSPGLDNLESGGRIAVMPDGKLLLTLGDHGMNGLNGPALAQSKDADFGKLLVVDLEGHRSVLSIGHRNPQGLYIGTGDRIWETEHGPQGGDELNLIAPGNYGWPYVTYGADYGFDTWPLMPATARDHGDFVEPVYAFLPSIGISNLIEVKGAPFDRWNGDLLIASLRAHSLFRARLRGDKVTYVEPISIGRRIRDLSQGKDGRILLWTDTGDIAVLSVDVTPPIYERCSGCHEASGGIRPLGPSLRDVLGRPIGSDSEYDYSMALDNKGGTWTEENLDAFLKDPYAFAPGTKMKLRGIADPEERATIIEFLKQYTSRAAVH